ncbi:MAG TPA: DUF501 domain-containing protein [Spirochaetota bacterium]|nr:DUF501 domain-containing protein [Spirochaetota bacterium]HPV96340.1 DUF501 domain-containing protein [Spirochaetota bacterium]
MTRNDYSYNEADLDVVRWQIDRESIFASGVLERCAYGYPRIILLDIDAGGGKWNYEAVSNVFWLTCPYLNERIHQLEQVGYIDRIGEFINRDISIAAKMESAHAHMYFFRKRICNAAGDATIPAEIRRVMDAGVGGARDTGSLKCLHAHFCHYRVCADNVAGMIATRLLDNRIDCEEVRCRNAVKRN